MKGIFSFAISAFALLQQTEAAGVTGRPEGFAQGTTGGGNVPPVYPSNIQELTSYLTDSEPRVIILNKEFNFIGSEGKVTGDGCHPASDTCGARGQDAINAAGWCNNGNAGDGSFPIKVTYDKAGVGAINVGSNKSIVGEGSSGVIRGKGLRVANGAQNVIIQNIHITELNPQFIWGGDAITLDGTDLVWIDHVKLSLIGRQMFVAGFSPSKRVTISNSEFDGQTQWSSSCDGHHYWAMYMLGSEDFITLKNNYIHHTSGRSPKVGGKTLLHAVNNVWSNNTGHAFDVGPGSMIVAEGNILQDVKTPLVSGKKGQLFSSPDSGSNKKCAPFLGRDCLPNLVQASGVFASGDTGFFREFQGKTVASASAPNAEAIIKNAGVGKT